MLACSLVCVFSRQKPLRWSERVRALVKSDLAYQFDMKRSLRTATWPFLKFREGSLCRCCSEMFGLSAHDDVYRVTSQALTWRRPRMATKGHQVPEHACRVGMVGSCGPSPALGCGGIRYPHLREGLLMGSCILARELTLREFSARFVRENRIRSDGGPRRAEVRLGSGPLSGRGRATRPTC